MLGGAFLCFEGFEKLAHKFLHSPEEDRAHREAHAKALAEGGRGPRLGSGWHACLGGQPDAVWRRFDRDAALKKACSPARPILMRYLNDPSYKVDTEQRIRLYVPLEAGVRPEDLSLLL